MPVWVPSASSLKPTICLLRSVSVILVALSIVFVREAAAQETVSLSRLTGPVVLDGIVDEPAWDAIEPYDMVMYQPTFGGEMSERTEIRVGYDDDFVYVSGRLYDSDPNGVRSYSLYRDRYSGDDTFAIILDTFDDNENALWFFTTPQGVRNDMAISNDANSSGGSGAMNGSWNTFWDASTTINDDGWSAEIRIPFSSLGFQVTDGKVQMGMIVYRFIARKNERHIFPAIPPNWSLGFAKPSVAQNVMLSDVVAQRPLYITPYVAGGADRRAELLGDESAYRKVNSFEREIGVDVKYNVLSNLTLDVTVNTDFAQVEADDQQVNLTRFSLFFPEKRQFFQERAGVFEFRLGGPNRLFHSRQIGVADGELVRILGGARLVGRVGQWDVGFIDLQTARSTPLELASENFGVLRARRQVVNQNSYVGGMATSRIGYDGVYNFGFGADGLINIRKDDFITVQVAHTLDSDYEDGATYDFIQATQARLVWERRTEEGLFYDFTAVRVGELFNPGVGFNTRTGVSSGFVKIGYGQLAPDWSRFRRISPSVKSGNFFRNDDGKLDSRDIGGELDVDFKSGGNITLEVENTYEDLPDSLLFADDASVPPGTYSFTNSKLSYRTARSSALRLSTSAAAGTFFDGTRYELSLEPTWALSKHVELKLEWDANFINFEDRDQSFSFHLLGVRAQFALNKQFSSDVFFQYNTAADFAVTNVRFRYNFREGSDLWFVFSEGLNRNRIREYPVLPLSSSRTAIVKYTYTFGS